MCPHLKLVLKKSCFIKLITTKISLTSFPDLDTSFLTVSFVIAVQEMSEYCFDLYYKLHSPLTVLSFHKSWKPVRLFGAKKTHCEWFKKKRSEFVYRSVEPCKPRKYYITSAHGLRTPREEIAFTARPKIQSQSQIFRYGRSIFCLPHQPNFSDIFYLCLHWVSVVRGHN